MSKNITSKRKSGATVRSTAGLCVGKIMPKTIMILRLHIGEAERGKLRYAMSSGINGQPILMSEQTGKWFTISWQEILELAVKAGIDA